jgi:multidrug efflux pump subunit AcrA (membrane-fusion protein)
MAKVTAERWSSLRASAAVSQQTADEKDSDARVKAAEVESAQANVDRLKALKGFANTVAPFDGVVTARNVDVGALVKAEANDNPALSRSPTLIRCGFTSRFPNRTRLSSGTA